MHLVEFFPVFLHLFCRKWCTVWIWSFPDFSGGDSSTVLTSKIRIWKARHWACWAMVKPCWEMYIVWGSSHCVFVCCEYKWSSLWDTAPGSCCCWQKHAQVYPATLKRIMMSTWTMSLSARRPREDTLTSSPSSSSIAEGIGSDRDSVTQSLNHRGRI